MKQLHTYLLALRKSIKQYASSINMKCKIKGINIKGSLKFAKKLQNSFCCFSMSKNCCFVKRCFMTNPEISVPCYPALTPFRP